MSYTRKRNGFFHWKLSKCNGVEKRLLEKHNGVESPMFKLDITTTASPQTWTVPLYTSGSNGATYNFNIDWGDGSNESNVTSHTASHEYATAGTYTVRVRGICRGWRQVNAGDKTLPVDLKQWGMLEPLKEASADTFSGCANMAYSATDNWDGLEGTEYGINMFFNCAAFDCDNAEDWDVSSMVSTSQMFQGSDFQTDDLSSWDVGSNLNFYAMFNNCANFNGTVGGWDTSSATNMGYMFSGCTIFNKDLSSWDVSGVSSIIAMFYQADAFNNGGQALSTYTGGTPTGWNTTALSGTGFTNCFRETALNVDISGLDLNGVTSSTNVFQDNIVFNQDISDWDMSTVTSIQSWFYRCDAFNNGGQALSWTTTALTNCQTAFYACVAFNVSIDDWDVSNVTSFNSMFFACSAYNQDMSSWTLNSSTGVTMSQMFWNATAFNQDISDWDVSKVSTMYWMFYGATAFNNGGVALDWADTSEVTNMQYMLGGVNNTVSCKLNVDLSAWDTSAVTDMRGLFQHNTSFNQDISDWDVSSVQDFYSTFNGATAFNNGGAALSDYNGGGAVLGWVTTAATNMYSMFQNCDAFNQDVSGFDMNGVTDCQRMFNGCDIFNCGGNSEMDNWDMSTVETMYEMFQNAEDFNIDIGSWSTSSCSNFYACFNSAETFNQDISTWDWSAIDSAQDLNYIVASTALSTANYDLLLQAWDAEPISSMTIVSTGCTYTSAGAGGTARTSLVNDHSCTISGDSGV